MAGIQVNTFHSYQPDGGPLQGQHVGTIHTRTFVGSHPEVPASLHLIAEISVDMMHLCAVLSSPCKPPPCATGEVADGLHRSATASVGDDISVDLESITELYEDGRIYTSTRKLKPSVHIATAFPGP